MSDAITIPKSEYNFLKKCEKTLKSIKEDDVLREEEIKLIEEAKRSKKLSKAEFLNRFDKLQNA